MSELQVKSVCILGRQPQLGLAELERIYGPEHIRPADGVALLDIEASDIDFRKLGGSLKVARVLNVLPTTDWNELLQYLIDNIPDHLKYLPEGKFTLGLSLYGLPVKTADINKGLLELKKIIKRQDHPVRVVPNKSAQLNSAQVLHNKLTSRGAWELLLIKHGRQTILAQTMFVQDIDAYAARDQARPKRDARVGMLPPKLAQIIVNLAVGELEKKLPERTDKLLNLTILDPFCGTGVILQEAMLMGYSATGSDIEQRLVDYSRHNLLWLIGRKPSIQGRLVLEVGDATVHRWPPFSTVASELYLGRPLTALPSAEKLKIIINDVNTITKKFLQNIAPQIKKDRQICLAVPAWRLKNGDFQHLPLIDHLTDMGYNRVDLKHVSSRDLIYWREGQTIGRQLLLLEKS